jgi:diketogulonate reductase-like aldo/keto reductase
MSEVAFPDGAKAPALGLGTWRMGERRSSATAETAAVREALRLGYRLIDCAEMYGDGGAESVVGQALREAKDEDGLERDAVFLVSKVLPSNATASGVVAACKRSRERLGVPCIDLYLLHWRGSVPLRETVKGLRELVERGWIARWGVSNFDVDDLEELFALEGGDACAANQVWFSLGQRGPGVALLPWMQQRSMPLMAYSPFDQGALVGHAVLAHVAARHGCTAAQVALAWLLGQRGVMAIPKSVHTQRLAQNWHAHAVHLSGDDHAALDAAFPPPRRGSPLAMN